MGDAWRHVRREYRDQASNPRCTCHYCGKQWVSSALQRASHHLSGCRELPVEHWAVYQPHNLRIAEQLNNPATRPALITHIPSRSHNRRPSQSSRASNRSDNMSARETAEMNRHFARFVYSSGLSLALAHNFYFRQYISRYRPSRPLPDRHSLGGTMLNEEHRLLYRNTTALIRRHSGRLTLVLEDWVDSTDSSLINYMLVNQEEAAFYKADASILDRRASSAGQYAVTSLLQTINEIGAPNLLAIIVEDSRKFEPDWAELQTQYPTIFYLEGGPRMVSIIAQQILEDPYFAPHVHDIGSVTEFFRVHGDAAQQLKQAQEDVKVEVGTPPPKSKQWREHYELCNMLLKSQLALRMQALDASLQPDPTHYSIVRGILAAEEFWKKTAEIVKILKPLIITADALGSGKPYLSQLYSHFMWLIKGKGIPRDLASYDIVRRIVVPYFRRVLQPVTAVAFILDPTARIQNVDNEVPEEMILRFCRERYGEPTCSTLCKQIVQVMRRDGPFSNQYLWNAAESMDAISWWQSHFAQEFPQLVQLAELVLTISILRGAEDRNAFNFEEVKHQNRAWLSDEQAEKLAYVHWNLRIQMEDSWAFRVPQNRDEDIDEFDDDNDLTAMSSE